MGIFKVFSIIHRFLADCLACHHISLALKKQSGAGGGGRKERSPAHIVWRLLALRKKDLDVKDPGFFFPVIASFRIFKVVSAYSMCLIPF